mgnify:CR=1 FL=1
MVEALSLAGMTETPVVIAEVQRPGPSTGLPTRTEQGDLSFVVNAAHGEFPRLVLTPGTIEEAFAAGVESFNLAEKYQSPVIMLSDQHLADSVRTVDPERLDMENAEIDRGKLLTANELDDLSEPYRRYEFTSSGISPRAFPGHENAVYSITGNEHDQTGKITEDPEIRNKMVEKRMQKLEGAKSEVNEPTFSGPSEADLNLLGWGSTYGALQEAMEELNDRGIKCNLCHLSQCWPLPEEELSKWLQSSGTTVVVEGNKGNQLGKLLSQEIGFSPDEKVLKYDGRPFTPEYILENINTDIPKGGS